VHLKIFWTLLKKRALSRSLQLEVVYLEALLLKLELIREKLGPSIPAVAKNNRSFVKLKEQTCRIGELYSFMRVLIRSQRVELDLLLGKDFFLPLLRPEGTFSNQVGDKCICGCNLLSLLYFASSLFF
jgi:hypothetical protein